MKIGAEHQYDYDIDTVYELLCDPQFLKRKFEAVGARNVEVIDFSRDESHSTVTIRRDMPAAAPAILRSVIGEWNTLTQKENWDGEPGREYWNELEIDAELAPVTITGTMSLQSTGDGCVNHIELNVRCPIPLVGRKVEAFVAADAEDALDKEFDFTAATLADGTEES